jgi:hypothetical protein
MIQKIFGEKVDVKLESNGESQQANSKDIYDESESANRHPKAKKVKKEKKEKKSKKEKSKKIKKEKSKGKDSPEAKLEDEDYVPGSDR